MHNFQPGDQVFPKWSQYLPAFTVIKAGPVMITIAVKDGVKELMHHADLVLRDPAANYGTAPYSQVG